MEFTTSKTSNANLKIRDNRHFQLSQLSVVKPVLIVGLADLSGVQAK